MASGVSLKEVQGLIIKRESDKHQYFAQIYMKAMCLKKMHRFSEASATYKLLANIIKRAEHRTLARCIFSLITLFTIQDRDKQYDQLDQLKTLMEFFDVPKDDVGPSLLLYYIPNDGWISDRVDDAIQALKNRCFF